MRELKFKVKGQRLSRDPGCNFNNIIKGTKNYLSLNISFNKDWDNLMKVVYFLNTKTYYPLKGNYLVIPDDALEHDVIGFRIIGKSSSTNQTILTNDITVKQVN